MHLRTGLLAAVLAYATSPAWAEQRNFPTGEPGVSVIYADQGEVGRPTVCVISVVAGLPALGFSLMLHSDNTFTLLISSELRLPETALQSDATLKVNSVYIFAKVTGTAKRGGLNAVYLSPVKNMPMRTLYDVVNQLVHNTSRVDVVADDAQLPSITLAPKPGLGDAFNACQHYLVTH